MQSLERTGLNTQSRVHINKVEQLLNSVLAEVQEQANRLAALEGRVGPANDTTVSAQLQKLGDELRQQQQQRLAAPEPTAFAAHAAQQTLLKQQAEAQAKLVERVAALEARARAPAPAPAPAAAEEKKNDAALRARLDTLERQLRVQSEQIGKMDHAAHATKWRRQQEDAMAAQVAALERLERAVLELQSAPARASPTAAASTPPAARMAAGDDAVAAEAAARARQLAAVEAEVRRVGAQAEAAAAELAARLEPLQRALGDWGGAGGAAASADSVSSAVGYLEGAAAREAERAAAEAAAAAERLAAVEAAVAQLQQQPAPPPPPPPQSPPVGGGDAGEEEDGWDDRGGTTGRLLDFEAQLSALGGRCAALESVHGRLLNLERATEARAAATADEARAAVERVAAEADSERARLSAALAALEEAHAALADEGRAATAEVRAELRRRLDDVISREELESSLLIAIRKLEQSLEVRFANKMDREEWPPLRDALLAEILGRRRPPAPPPPPPPPPPEDADVADARNMAWGPTSSMATALPPPAAASPAAEPPPQRSPEPPRSEPPRRPTKREYGSQLVVDEFELEGRDGRLYKGAQSGLVLTGFTKEEMVDWRRPNCSPPPKPRASSI